MESKKSIDIPIYFGELIIIKTDDLVKVGEKYKRGDFTRYAAVVWRDYEADHLKLYAAFTTNPKFGTIAHECVHLVNHVFHATGTDPDVLNDEPQAYLMGWFATQITNCIYGKERIDSENGTIAK